MRAGTIIFLLFTSTKLFGQCPITDFTVPSTACISENLLIQNSTTGAVSFDWDFCSGDIALTPTAGIAANDNLLFRTRSIRVVENSGNWYGFTIDQASSPNRLIRFNFGSSLSNSPVVTDLGNPSSMLNGAYDFQMHFEGGNWYALVANSGGNNILKLTFGASLDATPSIQNMGNFGALNTPNGIFIVNDNGSLSAFVTNGGASQIVRLDFGSSIVNTPTATTFSVTGGSALRGISIVRECDRWFGLVTSYGNGKVFWLDFNSGLGQPPQTGEITFFTAYNFPASISIVTDDSEYFSFIQSALGPLYRLSFGSSIIDKTGTGQDLGSFGVSENFATEWVKESSDWYGFSIDLSNRRLVRYTFPTTCDATIPVYSGSTPPINTYASSGTKKISVTATNGSGALSSMSKTVTVSANVSPDIAFTSQNICVNHDIQFTSINSSGNITGYDWDFGDSNSSIQPNPVHQYSSSDEYQITLEVTASNGCKNFATQSLTTFAQPVADFTTPSASPLCTNQNFIFDNTSSFDLGYVPTWEWRVNGSIVTTNEDLAYAFLNSSNHEIRLKASIPGCENEKIENINSLVDGPIPDFSFVGQCEESDVAFTNNSSGTISGYSWNFDDGQSSAIENPLHTFSDQGVYDVELTVSNIAGCNNTISKAVTIYSKPQVNFNVLDPPFSCNGTPTEFRDLTPNPTDSNLSAWQWNFGDAGSSQNTSTLKNPQHVYDNAGVYDVSLTVFTNFLCSANLQLPIAISQSPIADFFNSAPCEDIQVDFSDASTGNIISWEWQIGSTIYATENPTHIFLNAGGTNAILSVTADNGCIGSINKPIVVPGKLMPDFTVLKNCVNQETVFTDATIDAADPIDTHQWEVPGGATATGSPAIFTFSSTGIQNVKLEVTTQTGCEYSITKPVTIISSPVANFTATPETGGPPLVVQFTNTSVNANQYQWAFNDANNSTSTVVSPIFTYEDIGEYQVELTAFNAQNCSHSTNKIISVVMPAMDVGVSGLELTQLQGGLKPSVTINNYGNIPINNLPLLLNISGSIIRENVNATIPANSSYHHVFQFVLPSENALDYFCVEAEIDDINLQNNEACLTLQESFTTLTPHPNPSTNGTLNLSWILDAEGTVNLKLVNSMGQTVEDFQFVSVEGLNQFSLATTGIGSGVYFVRFNYKQITKVYRVIISE